MLRLSTILATVAIPTLAHATILTQVYNVNDLHANAVINWSNYADAPGNCQPCTGQVGGVSFTFGSSGGETPNFHDDGTISPGSDDGIGIHFQQPIDSIGAYAWGFNNFRAGMRVRTVGSDGTQTGSSFWALNDATEGFLGVVSATPDIYDVTFVSMNGTGDSKVGTVYLDPPGGRAVSEPGALGLLGIGLMATLVARRRVTS